MIHDLAQGTLSTGGSLNCTVSGQTINGLVLFASAAWDPLDTLQVTRKTAGKSALVQLNSFSVRSLAEMSDQDGGFSQTARAALAAETGDSQVLFPVIVPLGCLQMAANSSELEITLRKGAGSSVVCGIATYVDEDETDHALVYTETRDTRDKFSNVRKAYVISNADLIAYNTKVASVLVQSPFGATVAQISSLLAYSMARLQNEWQAPLRVLRVFTSPDPIPDTVEVTITGADATSFSILVVQVHVDAEMVSRGTISSMERIIGRVRGKTPNEQSALQRAGIVAKPAVLNGALRRMNTTPSSV